MNYLVPKYSVSKYKCNLGICCHPSGVILEVPSKSWFSAPCYVVLPEVTSKKI